MLKNHPVDYKKIWIKEANIFRLTMQIKNTAKDSSKKAENQTCNRAVVRITANQLLAKLRWKAKYTQLQQKSTRALQLKLIGNDSIQKALLSCTVASYKILIAAQPNYRWWWHKNSDNKWKTMVCSCYA